MLRLSVLLLVLLNAGYLAWTSGLLAAYGFAPVTQSEPQRMSQQIRPESLRILIPATASQPDSGAFLSSPGTTAAGFGASMFLSAAENVALAPTITLATFATECLQAGLFNEEQTVILRTRLQSALPAGSWVLESSTEPGRWMVYMGKYSSAEALSKKKRELRQFGVAFEALNNAALEPGMSLGTFASRAEADEALVSIVKRGVRTARVIQALAEPRGQKLKLASVDASLRRQLETIAPQLAGKALLACS